MLGRLLALIRRVSFRSLPGRIHLRNAALANVHAGGAVTVTAARSDGHVEISVADEGAGIPDHERVSIDDDTEISQLEHGAGVGPWVVRSVVDAYDGTFSIGTENDTAVKIRLSAARMNYVSRTGVRPFSRDPVDDSPRVLNY